jgi:hypothetical protein
VGSERDAFTVAGELCRQHKGTEAVMPPLKVFFLLRKHVRHRDDKVVQAQGKLRMSMAEGSQPGVMYVSLSVALPDGTSSSCCRMPRPWPRRARAGASAAAWSFPWR